MSLRNQTFGFSFLLATILRNGAPLGLLLRIDVSDITAQRKIATMENPGCFSRKTTHFLEADIILHLTSKIKPLFLEVG